MQGHPAVGICRVGPPGNEQVWENGPSARDVSCRPEVPADADPQAAAVYAAEERAVDVASLRRFNTFAEIEAYIERVTISLWWSERFPDAPIEVVVQRRSRTATFSAAATTDDHVGIIALVDGVGWGLETVLHELAHLAAGRIAAHGAAFRHALADLWRHEAGVEAWAALDSILASDPSPGRHRSPRS